MNNTLDYIIENMGRLEKTLGYTYKSKQNAVNALTHSSYANENKSRNLKDNERYEFLGDAVLNLVISEHIFKKFMKLSEGELTKIRAAVVCEPSLMKCANKLGIGDYLLLGKGEEHTGGRTRASILSDAFEAVIGSIYLDGGFEKARSFIIDNMQELIEDSLRGEVFIDYKTQLQEYVQKNGDCKVSYEIIEEKGPDHNKFFVSQVSIAGKVAGKGEGKSKKEAEQNAAKYALSVKAGEEIG